MATLLTVGLASGCAAKDPGRPSAETSAGGATETGTKSSSPSGVSGPDLDLSKFASNPCGALTADQLAPLGSFKAPEPGTGTFGPNCWWKATKVLEGAGYKVTMVTNGTTIDTFIDTNKSLQVFKETTVGGLKAASWDQTNASANCSTAVGTSSKGAILVQMNIENTNAPESKDTCAASEKVAALVVQNLKG